MDDDVWRLDLREQLSDGQRIRRSADRRRRAEWDHKRFASGFGGAHGGRIHGRRPFGAAWDVANVSAEQTIQQGIAGWHSGRRSVRDQDAPHAEMCRHRGGRPGVVRLNASAGNQRIRTQLLCLRGHELKLADLVSPESKWDRIVALGEQSGSRVQHRAQAAQFVDGRSAGPERQSRKRLETSEYRTAVKTGSSQNR